MSDFIKCPKGHVYDSGLDECPYCNGKELDNDLNDLPKKTDDEDDTDDSGNKFPPLPPPCYAPMPSKPW